MTLADFLAALPDLTERYAFYDDEIGELRAFVADGSGHVHSALTALAEAQTGVRYDPCVEWDIAARALGLSPEDASAIVSAEDRDLKHDQDLARALRQAVGVGGHDA